MTQIELTFGQSLSKEFFIKDGSVVYKGENDACSEDFDELVETVSAKITQLDLTHMRIKCWQILAINRFSHLSTLILDNCNLR